MDKYYYLIASLPLLKFTEAPLMTRENFMAEAEKWLSREDFIILANADINDFSEDKKDTSLLKEWKEFEYSARAQLLLFRRARRKDVEYKMRIDFPRLKPITDYMKPQGRFRHLTDEVIEDIQAKVIVKYEELRDRAASDAEAEVE